MQVRRVSVRPPQLSDARALAEAELVCFSDPWPPQFFVSEILADGRFNRLLVDAGGDMVAYLFAPGSTSTCMCSKSRHCRGSGGQDSPDG
jgi:hypothetical protein